VGCSKSGKVDTAISLLTGDKVGIPGSVGPGLTEGAIYSPERGHIKLAEPDAARPSMFERSRFADRRAPPAVGRAGVAVVQLDTIDVLPAGGRVIRQLGEEGTPSPLGWQPPAIAGDLVVWAVDAGEHGADLWSAPISGGPAQLLSGGPGDQHHVTAQGPWLAWVTPQGVIILDTRTGVQASHSAATGFSAGLALWQGVACWETREGTDVDIDCSDGHGIRGPGHQRHPSRWDRWLLYREESTVYVRTLEAR
jgi:hypothetical protein